MKIPISWLSEYVPIPADPAGLATFNDTLTMAGLEVEETFDSPAGVALYTKITPNRGDWASVYGTAREAAAALNVPMKPYAGYPARAPEPTALAASVPGASAVIEAPDLCHRFSLTVIRGVRVAPSPQWMQDRLTAAGMRPVNNVVDITNYVLLETGQPLHAFDLATVPEGRIVVREARAGETVKTLDGVDHALQVGILVIADAEKPIGIAGVMGGAATEISGSTTDILLEAAHFDAGSVRRTAKRLALGTEASYRFERFVDPLLVAPAAARAAALLAEIAGGVVQSEIIDIVARRFTPRRVVARVERIKRLLGADVERDAAIAGLERLGISVERSAGAFDCVIPAWRPDITREDDIAEEVGRIALGYANLPETLPPVLTGRGSDSRKGRFVAHVREFLVRAGLQDVHTHSLVAPSPLDLNHAAHRVLVRSALSVELSSLRTSLLPNLLQILARAHAGGTRDAAIFEAGSVYRQGDGAYSEPLRITGALTGSALPTAWGVKGDALPADFYYARGIAESLLRSLGATDVSAERAMAPNFHPGRTARLLWDGEPVGVVAEVSEAVIVSHELPRRVYVFDLDGDALLARYTGEPVGVYEPISKYPAVTRDLAPVFATTVPFARIEQTATEAAGAHLERFALTDIFAGANLGANRHALTLRFTFRSATGTLKDAEVENALAAVRAALETVTGAEFRV